MIGIALKRTRQDQDNTVYRKMHQAPDAYIVTKGKSMASLNP